MWLHKLSYCYKHRNFLAGADFVPGIFPRLTNQQTLRKFLDDILDLKAMSH